MIQPVAISYFFGSSDCFARIDTEQTVTWTDEGVTTERSADYTLTFANLSDEAQADFTTLWASGQADGEPLQAFLSAHGLTLGNPDAIG